jgi:hypothetical protein
MPPVVKAQAQTGERGLSEAPRLEHEQTTKYKVPTLTRVLGLGRRRGGELPCGPQTIPSFQNTLNFNIPIVMP